MELRSILEALLFVSQKALSPREIKEVLAQTAAAEDAPPEARPWRKVSEGDIEAELNALATQYEQAGHSYRLVCVAGAWQFVSKPEFAPWIRTLVGVKARPPRLSQPALETLAIIAYRQPVTRAEIEQIRGVNVDGVMQTLLERGLIQELGRAETVGRPMTYGTTDLFLEYFGLRSLEDLPAADELRRWTPPAPVAAGSESAPAASNTETSSSMADARPASEAAAPESSASGTEGPSPQLLSPHTSPLSESTSAAASDSMVAPSDPPRS
ncbi:MAG: SMC-Scp complex subunit ScpB [Limisphaera sp.]